MQQRQLRLGDILDDYCPRERRLTNHAVVAMVGEDVKQTRCTTCDAEHEYKHAKVPRQRRKLGFAGGAVFAGRRQRAQARNARIRPRSPACYDEHGDDIDVGSGSEAVENASLDSDEHADDTEVSGPDRRRRSSGRKRSRLTRDADEARADEEGPVHRPLIRATLPRPRASRSPARPIPEFTIRQPGGRPNRFRPRNQARRAAVSGDRSNGNGPGAAPQRRTQAPWWRPPAPGRDAVPSRRDGTVPAIASGPSNAPSRESRQSPSSDSMRSAACELIREHDRSVRETRPRRGRGQQAVDLVGDRRGGRAAGRVSRSHIRERLEENVRELAAGLTDPLVLPCDVSDDEQIAALFAKIEQSSAAWTSSSMARPSLRRRSFRLRSFRRRATDFGQRWTSARTR